MEPKPNYCHSIKSVYKRQKSMQKPIQYSVSGPLFLHGSGAQTLTSPDSVRSLFGPVWRRGSFVTCGVDLPLQTLLFDSCLLSYPHPLSHPPFTPHHVVPLPSSPAHSTCVAWKVSGRVQGDS